jgi:hypothetical protein
VTSADPGVLLKVAQVEFARHGNADRLELVAQLLNAMGGRALPALEAATKNAFPGQDVLVDLIAFADNLDEPKRMELLAALAKSQFIDTRHRLLQVVPAVRDETRILLLRLLAQDADPKIRRAAENLTAS